MHSVDSACTSFQRAAESDLEKIIPAVSGSGHQQEGILQQILQLGKTAFRRAYRRRIPNPSGSVCGILAHMQLPVSRMTCRMHEISA